jgi:hypothetical protein
MGRAFGALLRIAAIAVRPTPSAQAAGADTELAGMYALNGTNPDGTQYRGFVHIAHRGESLMVSWMFPKNSDGKMVLVANSVGVGIVSDGMLAVSYYGSGAAGIVLYRIEEDGHRLAGHWTVAGQNGKVYSETLIRLPWEVMEPGVGGDSDKDAPDNDAPDKPAPDKSTPDTDHSAPPPSKRPARPIGSDEV